ncbi:MAG: site-2 protease family protein, partial [Candidatus Krumholzibacteria bacterium]|nr:site-2 protease family protein [Candidatus Krumholzibacteria bacterium]
MLLTVIAGAFVLSVVVLVHEFGHFIVAKWSGVFVKTFSIGFGKKILKWRPGETEYAISILP